MSSDDERRDGRNPGPPEHDPVDEVEASLNEALNDLEQMLQRHESGEATGAPAPIEEAAGEHDAQYAIPLLSEVVIPGIAVAAEPGAADPTAIEAETRDEEDEPALRRRLAARLASEVEVIVQDRMESALEHARDEIHRQVRNHMDIILPEIVEELIQLRSRRER